MKICRIMKDGGPESKVTGFFVIEIKSMFSIVILRFDDGARDAYHTHAFNAISWVLNGKLVERNLGAGENVYWPSIFPIWTPRERFHRVTSRGVSWAITFRGSWKKTWRSGKGAPSS